MYALACKLWFGIDSNKNSNINKYHYSQSGIAHSIPPRWRLHQATLPHPTRCPCRRHHFLSLSQYQQHQCIYLHGQSGTTNGSARSRTTSRVSLWKVGGVEALSCGYFICLFFKIISLLTIGSILTVIHSNILDYIFLRFVKKCICFFSCLFQFWFLERTPWCSSVTWRHSVEMMWPWHAMDESRTSILQTGGGGSKTYFTEAFKDIFILKMLSMYFSFYSWDVRPFVFMW